MKLLSINDSGASFRGKEGALVPIDKLTKEDLMQLVSWTLDEETVEYDAYDESRIKNQAHQIVYKSVVQKLKDLRERRKEFRDESSRLFLKEYERYKPG
jgi:hypothetical protein